MSNLLLGNTECFKMYLIFKAKKKNIIGNYWNFDLKVQDQLQILYRFF